MAGERLRQLVKDGALIGYRDPNVLVSVAYVELWRNALYWCSTENGAPGGPHVLPFTEMKEESNQVNFYTSRELSATLAPYDEWPEIEDAIGAYRKAWQIWNADPEQKRKAETYWHEAGQELSK